MSTDLSQYVARFIDYLFLDNPQGTAMGALGGAVAMFVVRAFQPLLTKQDIIDLTGVPALLYVCVGIFSANWSRYRRGNTLPAPIEARLLALRKELHAGRLSKEEVQRLYCDLLEDTMPVVLNAKKRARRGRQPQSKKQ